MGSTKCVVNGYKVIGNRIIIIIVIIIIKKERTGNLQWHGYTRICLNTVA